MLSPTVSYFNLFATLDELYRRGPVRRVQFCTLFK